jgi:integrating conjugative element protein (TIGR03749 family)
MNLLRPLSLLLCILPVAARAVEILQWQRLPLAVPLHVDQERVIFVDQNVRVGLPRSLQGKLRIQTSNGAIYLRASETIEPTRLQLQNVSTGELILMDIAATPAPNGAELEPVKIVRAESPASPDKSVAEPEPPVPPRQTPIPVVLTRYAAQSLYAPLRTVEPLPGVSQVRVNPTLDLTTLLSALPVRTSTLGAWQLEDFWVTAVQLRNMSSSRLTLDPRELQGNFIATTFQHHTLEQQGKPADTTVVYLVTRGHGLGESLLPNLSDIDAASNLPLARGVANEK